MLMFGDKIQYLEEEGSNYKLTVDMPGLEKEEIKIIARNNAIYIKGENKKRKYDHIFTIPENLKEIDAEYKNGVLSLFFSKKELKEKQISIK